MSIVIRLIVVAFAFMGAIIYTVPTPHWSHATDVVSGELCAAVFAAVLMTFVRNPFVD